MISKEYQDFSCNLVAHSVARKAHYTPKAELLLYLQNYRERVITTTHCKENYSFLRSTLQSSELESTSFNLATGRFRDRKSSTNPALSTQSGKKTPPKYHLLAFFGKRWSQLFSWEIQMYDLLECRHQRAKNNAFKIFRELKHKVLACPKNPPKHLTPTKLQLILQNFNSHFTVVSILCYCVFYQLHPEGHLLQFWALLSSCQRSNSWSEKENQHIPVQTYSPL